jgi:colanic acid/amylovoran biosynthesis protein
MKKVFLYAYDRQNLGDDLFINTIVKRYPHVKFYLWSDLKNRQIFRCLPNLKILQKEGGMVQLLKGIRPSLVARYRNWLEGRCQAVVYIGGSIFMEYDNWEQILTWWEYMAEHRPFYVMGANFGPYHTEDYRKKFGQIYAKMKDVCFRDRYSYDLFREVAAVRQAPDILFSYPMPQVEVQQKQLFVSVIDCASRDESHGLTRYDEKYVENMAQLLNQYRREGYRLVLGSFCSHEGDGRGIRKIVKAMGAEESPEIQVLRYDGTNAEQITEAMAQSSLVIATRFHAAILAIVAGRPVLPVIYSDKTLHVLEDLGFEGAIIDIRSCEDYTAVEHRQRLPWTVRLWPGMHRSILKSWIKFYSKGMCL